MTQEELQLKVVSVLKILSIDTSGTVAAASVYDSDEDLMLAQQCIYTKKTHSQVILPLVERMLKDVSLSLNDIDKIAVAVGPGSYTGLRIGIAAVKAMTFALKISCCGISTLEALAYQGSIFSGFVCSVMKARQNLVYAGVYKNENNQMISILSDRIIDKDELCKYLLELKEPVLLIGDASGDLAGEQFIIAPSSIRLQNGIGLCMAAVHKESQSPNSLEAKYLQAVKAEKDRKGIS